MLDEARLTTRPRGDASSSSGIVAARRARRRRGRARRSPRAATRTRSRRSATARPCSRSGAPSSSWPASSSPTPSLALADRRRGARAAGHASASTWPRRAGGRPRAHRIRCGCGWRCRSARPAACASGQPCASRVEGDPTRHTGPRRAPQPRDRRAQPHAAGRGRGARTRAARCGPGSFATRRDRRPQADEPRRPVPATRARHLRRRREGAHACADGKAVEKRVTHRPPRRRPDRDRRRASTRGRAGRRRSPATSTGGQAVTRRAAARLRMQKLAEICIRRPVFAAMLILALVVVGAAELLPPRRRPLPVRRPAHGQRAHRRCPAPPPRRSRRRSPQQIEEAVNTVEGIDELRSISGAGHVDRHRPPSTSTATSTSPPRTCATASPPSLRDLPRRRRRRRSIAQVRQRQRRRC